MALTAAAQDPADDFFAQKENYFRNVTVEGASKHAEAPVETPATVTIISREDIELYGFRTVADILNFASAGYFTHNDRRYDFAGGRGLFFFEDFNTRLLVMLNGHPLNEPWNNFGGVGREMLVPMDLVERVEIIYGPSSLLYGGYSLYGIVNVVTQTGQSLAGSRVRATAGTWNTYELAASWGSSGVTASNRDWSVLVSAGYYTSDGEDLDLPVIEREDGSMFGGPQNGTDRERSPHLYLHANRGDFTLMARSGSRKHGAPLAPYDSTYGSTLEFVQDDKDFVELRWDRQVASGLTASVRAFRDWYRYQEHDPYEADDTMFVLDSEDDDTGAEARLTLRRGTHLVTGGVEYRTRNIVQNVREETLGGELIEDTAVRAKIDGQLLVVYLQEEWRPTNRWTLIAGGNYADTEPGGEKAQPRVAAIYKPRADIAIKALYGRGFRPPSVFEAEYQDNTNQLSNPTLTSEEISSAELSVIWNPRPSILVQAYAFDSRLEGLIRAVEVSEPGDVQGNPGDLPEDLAGFIQYQSTGDVESSGIGASANLRGGPWRGYANVAFANAAFDGGERLPASSRLLASSGLAYDRSVWAASMSARYVGPQLLDPDRGETGEAGDFFDANVRMLWRTRARAYPLTLTLDVLNVFDSDGSLSASPVYTPSRVPIEGRRALIGAELRF
jgi:outer membrane receptor for ferrienterochelin and colicins